MKNLCNQKTLHNALGSAQPLGCEILQGHLYHSIPIRRCIAFFAIFLSLVCWCQITLAENSGLTVRHGDRSSARIAITVDDCYDRKHISAAIDLSELYQVPITFFPIGSALKYDDAALWQRALDAGCEIGNHSWGHKNLTMLNARKIKFQMLRTQEKLDAMLRYHYPMQVMRPPFGSTNNAVSEAVESVGYRRIVKWDVSQTDYKEAIKQVQNGSILLYHARAKDIRCLTKLIPLLLEHGYECVTVSELLGLKSVATSTDLYVYHREQLDD